jgi:flagellar hook-length control protein FliK
MPTVPQNPPPSIQCDNPGSFSTGSWSKTNTPDLSNGDKSDNFLNTLKKVSQNPNVSDGPRRSSPNPSAQSEKADGQLKTKEETNSEFSADELLAALISGLQNDETAVSDQTPISADLEELIDLLEAVGLVAPAGETTMPAGGGAGDQNLSGPAGNPQRGLWALKQLIIGIQANDNMPSSDMSAGWERLRLFISNALGGETSAQNQESLKSVSGVLTGEGSGSEKTSDILSAMNRTAVDAAAETQNTPKETGTLKSAANSEIAPQSENSEKTGRAKLHPDNRTAADQTSNPVKENKFPDKVASDAPKVDAETDIRGKTEASNRTAELSRPSSATEASSVSKLINDAQVEKENPLKANPALNDDSGSKVVKMEAGTNDSGQLTSQTQTSPKAFEMATAAKETEAGQSALRNQTMEQIVRRAVVQVRGDGQHEARIDLKPDFLGHVHMKIITENQQVTVKILTEFGFVKDMIENNIHQLKADLQQHGLEVDKVDVSVSRDAGGNKHSQENADLSKNRQNETDPTGGDNSREKNQKPKAHAGLTADGLPTVDYFA